MKTETTINNDSAKITSDMTREERIATIKASINKKPEITESQEISPEEFPLLLEGELRQKVVSGLQALGYTFITLDLEG